MNTACRVLMLCLLGLCLPAAAQRGESGAKSEAAWYRVEVIIFRYLDPAEAEGETWTALPELAYPSQLQYLRAGAAGVGLERDYQLLQIEDTVPALDFDLAWDKSIDQLLREYQLSLEIRAQELVQQDDSLTEQPLVVDAMAVTIPVAFTPLPAAAGEFAEQASRIRRSRNMRLLFHSNWLQPVKSPQLSVPVVVDGVVTEGAFPALQGSLRLYVSRYLHLETNLWLNTGPVMAGQDWVPPQPPLPPQPYSYAPATFQVALEPDFAADIHFTDFHYANFRAPEPEDILQPITINANRIEPVDVEQFLKQPYYQYGQAVEVKQKRRMRSGELHYLDHPLLGLLIRVTPYEFEPFFDPETGLTPEVAENSQARRR